ncbi:uncharacterized protein ACLA_032090 [Aspergillus clavatus NRRL 1]|uniref:Uncharacterized protein n=1 Tax=Aspergillus clavatus (strain ATCC 1007 / CBS 513.65 / DSM 816 / NCTC 3887 / NRRL 1 / QM 1276 / 107) TaxID=344612 RepID=A1CS53_ASPCL|nr:uncharacterized protein ACLA_032090 [Aspergillus clavatus NRRL 1]EAW08474.1 conserved hypothetical protein [Aspergillus clavatus NRRL 1]
MVNWKTTESTDRLIAALIAANPGLKLEYQAMATLFGQGATYDAIEGRFRRYRKMADELRSSALSRGITELPRGRNGTASASSTPRTPRGPRGGITKPGSASSTGRSRKGGVKDVPGTPSRRGAGRAGLSLMDAIFVDAEAEEEVEEVKVKVKNEAAEILSGFVVGGGAVRGYGHELTASMSVSGTSSSAVSMRFEDGEEAGLGAGLGRAVKQEVGRVEGFVHGGDVGVAGLEQDAFDMAGLYFSQGQGGYDMDDIYGGAA